MVVAFLPSLPLPVVVVGDDRLCVLCEHKTDNLRYIDANRRPFWSWVV